MKDRIVGHRGNASRFCYGFGIIQEGQELLSREYEAG